jgi:hypothetical protein
LSPLIIFSTLFLQNSSVALIGLQSIELLPRNGFLCGSSRTRSEHVLLIGSWCVFKEPRCVFYSLRNENLTDPRIKKTTFSVMCLCPIVGLSQIPVVDVNCNARNLI